MASDQQQQQLRRDENRGEEREVHVESEKVPKIAIHFESLGKMEHEQDRDATQSEKNQTPSLEEISKYRGEAQQKSIETIRAAEVRAADLANKAKETSGSTLQKVKESTVPALGSASQYTTQKASRAKDTLLEKGQQTYAVTKDTVASAGKPAMDYTTQTAVQAKDASLETGKGAATYTGEVTLNLKDKAVAAGWGAAHLTAETAVEGTKTAARAVQGVAGYTADTAAAVGQKVIEVGSKPVEYVSEVAASTGESVKEYTARKKEEAKRDSEAKQGPGAQGEEKGEGMMEKVQQYMGGGEAEKGSEGVISRTQTEADSGVLGAIGETIVEIAQTAKGMMLGKDVQQPHIPKPSECIEPSKHVQQ